MKIRVLYWVYDDIEEGPQYLILIPKEKTLVFINADYGYWYIRVVAKEISLLSEKVIEKFFEVMGMARLRIREKRANPKVEADDFVYYTLWPEYDSDSNLHYKGIPPTVLEIEENN